MIQSRYFINTFECPHFFGLQSYEIDFELVVFFYKNYANSYDFIQVSSFFRLLEGFNRKKMINGRMKYNFK